MHRILIRDFIKQVLLEQAPGELQGEMPVEGVGVFPLSALAAQDTNINSFVGLGQRYRKELTGQSSPDLDALLELIAAARGCIDTGAQNKTYIELMALCIGFSGMSTRKQAAEDACRQFLNEMKSKMRAGAPIAPAAEEAAPELAPAEAQNKKPARRRPEPPVDPDQVGGGEALEESILRSLIREMQLFEVSTAREVVEDLLPSVARAAESQEARAAEIATLLKMPQTEVARIAQKLNARFQVMSSACQVAVRENLGDLLDGTLDMLNKPYAKITAEEAQKALLDVPLNRLLRSAFDQVTTFRFSNQSLLSQEVETIVTRSVRESAKASEELLRLESRFISAAGKDPANFDTYLNCIADIRAIRERINDIAVEAASATEEKLEKAIRDLAVKIEKPATKGYRTSKALQSAGKATKSGLAAAPGAAKQAIVKTVDVGSWVAFPTSRYLWRKLSAASGEGGFVKFIRRLSKGMAVFGTVGVDMAWMTLVLAVAGALYEWGEVMFDTLESSEAINYVSSAVAVMSVGPQAVIEFGQYLQGLKYAESLPFAVQKAAFQFYPTILSPFATQEEPTPVDPALLAANPELAATVQTAMRAKSTYDQIAQSFSDWKSSIDAAVDIAKMFPESGQLNVDVKLGMGDEVTAALSAVGAAFVDLGRQLQAAYNAYKDSDAPIFVGPANPTGPKFTIDTQLSDANFNKMFTPAYGGVGVENPKAKDYFEPVMKRPPENKEEKK